MTDRKAILVLTALFVISVLAVDPRGNFPLDDDWGVGFTTFTLATSGTIEFTPFASATAYLQFVWGAIWVALFGQSFTVLRLATLVLSLGSTLLAYSLLRSGGANATLASFGAAAFLFHPLFFWASFTSMTHVPYVFFSLVAATLFVRAWDREGVWLALAFAATVASFFTRQFAILNALAPLTVALIARRWRLAGTYAAAAAVFGLLVVSGTLVASQKELVLHRPSMTGLLVRAAHYVFFNWQHAALFFAPLLLLVLLSHPRVRLSAPVMTIAAILFGLAAWRMTFEVGMPIPYMNSGNVFTDFGLGPPTLRDVFTLRMAHPFALDRWVRLAMMLATFAAAVVAVGVTASAARSRQPLLRFAVAYCAIGTAIVAAMRIHFDRYSIDTLWPLGIVLALVVSTQRPSRAGRGAAAVAIAVLSFFAIAGTAEYLDWNRARWSAYSWLRANGVTLEQMDGGYEINSMLALRAGRKDLGKPGVGVVDDRFILTFNRNVAGFEPLRSFEYDRWLGLRNGSVWVQRRSDQPRP
jgi:hypothetical protein